MTKQVKFTLSLITFLYRSIHQPLARQQQTALLSSSSSSSPVRCGQKRNCNGGSSSCQSFSILQVDRVIACVKSGRFFLNFECLKPPSPAAFTAGQLDRTLPEPDRVCAVPPAWRNLAKLDRQENKLGHRMPRVNFTRTDRIAQMSKQEQIIAQKRQQILEKQRTLQMAKQIAAEASKASAPT